MIICDICLNSIFSLDIVFKLVMYGFRQYFRFALNIIEFILLILSVGMLIYNIKICRYVIRFREGQFGGAGAADKQCVSDNKICNAGSIPLSYNM